jgi:(1->4)-alpha-D-glucan 1-alpha-D-glucosylmutase
VGGDPGQFGISLSQFHATCQEAQAARPHSMLATSTHDTKRSEDLRARLMLLSEIPELWAQAINRWSAHNKRHRHADVPDRNSEYLIYQTLVGAYPIDEGRLSGYMEKAMREAKLYTSWTAPNESYEGHMRAFIAAIMHDELFQADLRDFVTPLLYPGWINSLTQTLIKLTAPGVPDLYQGAELWDYSGVDPDNRRPVDFGRRAALLTEVMQLAAGEVLARIDEGLAKMWLIWKVLTWRRQRPELFAAESSYQPLYAQGAKAEHLVAFMRGNGLIVLAPRLPLKLAANWASSTLHLPDGSWQNLLSGARVVGGATAIEVDELLADFPVAILIKMEV